MDFIILAYTLINIIAHAFHYNKSKNVHEECKKKHKKDDK